MGLTLQVCHWDERVKYENEERSVKDSAIKYGLLGMTKKG
jgi:hypothetical protein